MTSSLLQFPWFQGEGGCNNWIKQRRGAVFESFFHAKTNKRKQERVIVAKAISLYSRNRRVNGALGGKRVWLRQRQRWLCVDKQVVFVQIFAQVALFFCEVGGEGRAGEGGAPAGQQRVSNLEHTHTHQDALRTAGKERSRGNVSNISRFFIKKTTPNEA